jgi:hypothetical protein
MRSVPPFAPWEAKIVANARKVRSWIFHYKRQEVCSKLTFFFGNSAHLAFHFFGNGRGGKLGVE